MAGRESQQLPGKEAGLFRQVVKFYESKQYKKGLKAAEQILKKHPEHGETLAMKGLILSYQEKKAEAYELVRRGLKADLKSHVCWHVYGLLWRADNNYDEAIKCYKNALRIDKENVQILRDLALLQIQMRDYAGFIETRQTLLHLKASNRNNWISFAIAHHLNKDYELAVQILSGFESTQEEVPKGEEYEHSEMLLYKAMILEEGGQHAEALSQLERSVDDLKDRLGYEETRGRLLLRVGRLSDAEAVYRQLLDLNPDNYRYHDGLREALGLAVPQALNSQSQAETWSDEQRHLLQELYAELAEKYPRSNSPRRIPLDFLAGEAFEAALDVYVRKFLQKGVPSLFSDLKGLYRTAKKAEAVGRVFERLLAALQEDPAVLPALKAGGEEPLEPAGEALLWARIFLTRHYDRLGATGRAMELVEQCIAQEPDQIEVYSTKSRVLKHAGDLEGAAAAAYKAQSLDGADRYLNSMAAKALFRAGHVDRAEKMAALFTKDSDQPNLLYEMQCMWYEIECGSAYARRRDYGRALKNFLAVTKHFATFQEDQFDFHSYCVRKMTLRAYVNMLRMEDGILQNEFHAKAAFGAIEAYLALANAPADQKQSLEREEALLANLSLEEQKKHKLKKKKEAQKKAKQEEKRVQEAAVAAAKEREAAKSTGGKKQTEKGKEKDTDPDGAQLAAVEAPLEEAAKLLQVLREHSGSFLRTHLLGFEVALRRGKPLLALQAVRRAISLAGESHPDVHRITLRLCQRFRPHAEGAQNGTATAEPSPQTEVIQEVMARHIDALLGGASLDAFNKAYSQAEGQTSVAHRAAAAEMQVLLHPEEKDSAVALLLEGDGALECKSGASKLRQADCIEVQRLLEDRLCVPEAAQQWRSRCQKRFPWSAFFNGEKQGGAAELEAFYQQANGVKSPRKT